jgi:cell division protein FtsW (lipid II flippase)
MDKKENRWNERISRWLAVIAVGLLVFSLVMIPAAWVKAWSMNRLPAHWGDTVRDLQAVWVTIPELRLAVEAALSASLIAVASSFIAIFFHPVRWRVVLFLIMLAMKVMLELTSRWLISTTPWF